MNRLPTPPGFTARPPVQRVWLLLLLGLLFASLLFSSFATQLFAADQNQPPLTEPTYVVAKITFGSFAQLQWLATHIDVWEVHHADELGQGTVVALLPAAMLAELRASGYTVVIDEIASALLHWRPVVSAQQHAGIPGFPCYRTVEETYSALAGLAATHPTLARWVDIGDSWDKTHPGGAAGYDLQALVLTNQAIPGPKPVFFLMAAIHAREFTTAEVATRFAESLISRYGDDAEVTWLLDTKEIHIVAQANPDGRKEAEKVVLWRKNTNSDGCPNAYPFFSYYGVDLNRNSSFKWGACEGFDCSSPNTCVDTFRGNAAASEPETQALQQYMSTIFADQRGPADADAAPSDASGVMISLHSYSQLILFPWGWRAEPTANHTALETLGRKFGYFTNYEVCQSGEPGCIYQTDGTTDDWAYGELGVAAYTFELGTSFFQQCRYFEESMVDNTLAALFYAAKVADHPYQLPAGPEVLSISTAITDRIPVSASNSVGIVPNLSLPHQSNGEGQLTSTQPITDVAPILTVSAIADDTRYDSNGWGIEPSQVISAARLTVSAVSWLTATAVYPMNPLDGVFDSTVEPVQIRLQLSNTHAVQYYLLVESQDAAGNWGVPTAAFVTIAPPTGIVEEREPLLTQKFYLPLVVR
ncbi:MAG TPA: M14 family zinc carboxypeptidase [Caldilineaceae bacterium]|nr:M14 family zinc carboxypeptidase [Caldilineaceae bacterium]